MNPLYLDPLESFTLAISDILVFRYYASNNLIV